MTFKACSCVLFFTIVQPALAKVCRDLDEIEHNFYPLRHCQRSNQSVIVYSNVESLDECADLARINRGLAFNFSPEGRREMNFFMKGNESTGGEDDFYNCEILDCPEYRNFHSMVNDTRFDYYSLYARPPPSEDATCVPSNGMFVLVKERSNYSSAYNICASIGGNLAHIASEVRNVGLSKFLSFSTNSSTKERTAYVGLNETLRGKFLTSNSEPLGCFNYRAWAPGHPPEVRRSGCVAITPEASWKVFNCNRKLMFMCEILSSGPNTYVNNLQQKCSIERPNNRFMPRKTSKT